MTKKLLINMRAIKETVPEQHAWIEKQEPVDWYKVHRNEKGISNMIVQTSQAPISVYDMSNPKEIPRGIAKISDFHKNSISIVIGFGCGYLTYEILKKCDKQHKVIVIEPVAGIIKEGLSLSKFDKHIKEHRLIFTPTIEDVIYILSRMEQSKMLEQQFVFREDYTRMQDVYYDITKMALDTISQLKCNTGTVESAGGQIADNDMATLPYVIKHRGVAELQNLFEKKPAILVSTGPSLFKNIHLLMDKEVQKRFVIIAVGQALRVLLSYDIRPDFICSVDFGIVNHSHYLGLMDSDVPLIALNRSYAPLLKEWQGPKFVTVSWNPGTEGTVFGLTQDRGSLDQGGSVSHMIFGTAIAMGCDPIIIIGQDLAYDGEKSHIAQADSGGDVSVTKEGEIRWNVKDPRSKSLISQDHSMGLMQNVPGYYGDLVMTNIGLLTFITNFEHLFARYKDERTLINATEGGAKMKHIDQMSLKKAIKEHMGDPIDKTVIEPLLTERPDGDDLVDQAIPMVKEDIDNLDFIIEKSAEAVAKSEEVVKAVMPELAVRMKEAFDLTDAAHKAANKNPLVRLGLFKKSREIELRAHNVRSDTEFLLSKKGKKNLKIRQNRSKMILEEAIKVSKSLKKTYEETLKTLEKMQNGIPHQYEVEELHFRDSQTYFDAGNFARPLLDAKKVLNTRPLTDFSISDIDRAIEVKSEALAMRGRAILDAEKEYEIRDKETGDDMIKYLNLIEESQKIGREDKSFEESVKLLEEAHELKPDKPEALWGLATAYWHVKRDKESLKMYDKLLEQFPDEVKYKMEYATVLLSTGDTDKAFVIFKEVMTKTDEFNFFLKPLGRLYHKAGLLNEAITALEIYVEEFKVDEVAWRRLAEYYEEDGQKEKSADALSKANRLKSIMRVKKT